MKRTSLAIVVALSLSCGSEPSGTLTLTVNTLEKFASETTLSVGGSVSRDPASDTPIIVTIVGASATVSDTVVNQFNFTVQLKSNQENQLSVMAFDGTGSIADAVVVSVFHDDTGPLIVSSIPVNKQADVSLTTAIEVRYGEPLEQTSPSASFTLKQNSRPVSGTAALSADKTLFTFQPDQPLEPASIYEMVVSGFTDEAGNPAGGGINACFITTLGGLQNVVTTDTASTFFLSDPAPEVVAPVNMLGATLARSGATLYGLFQFQNERTLLDQVTRASVFLDLDLDNDAGTGFQSFKDFLFENVTPPIPSGIRAEAVISLDAHVVADSGFVGVNVGDAEWDVIDTFVPGVCGRFFGFHTTAILGDSIQDDGNFTYVYTAFASEDTTLNSTGVYADPVPVSGNFFADLNTTGPATLRSTPIPPRRVWPPQTRKAPLIRLLRWLRGR